MRSDEAGIESHPHRGQGEGAVLKCVPGLRGGMALAGWLVE